MCTQPDLTVYGVQGYIYIESVKESHVKDAISGLRMIRVSKGAKLVPEKEMVDAITISHTAKSILGEHLVLLSYLIKVQTNPASSVAQCTQAAAEASLSGQIFVRLRSICIMSFSGREYAETGL